jgi:transcriptional regulator with XRE-family HTH domain
MEYRRLSAVLASHGLSQSDLAAELGVRPAAVSRKIGGSRPWRDAEMRIVVSWLSGKGVFESLDSLFGAEAGQADVVSTPAENKAA